jgi:hypothetical protein
MRRELALAALLLLASAARADDGDGFQFTPSLYWQHGEHRIDLTIAVRSRLETWDAFAMDSDSFIGTRTRLKLQYNWNNQLVLAGEVQDVRVASLDSNGTGGLALYRNAADGDYNAHGTDVHLLWAEFRPTPTSYFRVGRQDLKVGPEVTYPEPDWRYLKSARLGERLIGSVGFSHEERAADGITVGWDLGGHQLLVFAAQPTSGVFEVDNAYRSLHDVTYEGAEWTVKRGTWLANTELTGFAIAYQDTRDPVDGGLPHGLSLATFGGSALGVYPLGPGKVDALVWGAGQLGSYDRLDQSAWAVFVEAGYQLPDLFLKPWLRAGVNIGSGDGDPTDDDHETFFNLLPTNHIYYGFMDQVELPNLIDPFVQLRLTPHPMVALNLFAHWFRLTRNSDARYSGSGVFNLDTFGFTAAPSRGFTHVGREYDVVATFTPHRTLTVEAGWSWFDGGAMFALNRSTQGHFGYVMAEFKY